MDEKTLPGVYESQIFHDRMSGCLSCKEWKSLAGELEAYAQHEDDCILSRWEGGEPTPDGGYRSKFAGKWYQSKPIDETPKCNCGLDVVMAKARELGRG